MDIFNAISNELRKKVEQVKACKLVSVTLQ